MCMLTTQFRMHPEIRRFPSEAFYENKLQDGPGEGRGGGVDVMVDDCW